MTTQFQTEICGTGCGLNTTLRIISGKWKPLVLFFLRDGPKRYGELRRLIAGVSNKVLIQQLKDLEADQVLARTDYQEIPPRVDYALTPLGRSLAEAIMPLCAWGTANSEEMASIYASRDPSSLKDAESL
ncbi:helix-turn-helix transcriptional regulator [Rahnella sp. C60]|jgi:DNA-binding HxlR family transcriptional regulator|uniref:Helix-turn-helix transcriptional regulator n=1 Tax=Rahnella perminowiae TaxID=2816244 RepID=A0ABS6L2H3_9GAMM|nr:MULTISPECIES: helix-turn-helix domain-containing protein [Rahnella]MBU9814197.1 helix-turn-helix transcriptional regulator [Rahnella perminowiae]MBU9835590.1 helix-turn-helix transcriptional regulator [Rahnella perminowiae]MCR9001885.1 helix-turn-helix transcriptional regulator [Rahnella perminowiae]MCX2944137.1 helix-turn-helix domain-containing protein [Rahnella perminowiae]